jgi:hypothetical protein
MRAFDVMPFRRPASYLSYTAYKVSFLESQNDTLTHVNIVPTGGSEQTVVASRIHILTTLFM